MEILRVENICKTYEMDNAPVHALSDVSFSVDKGEFVAIIGASGSGKSTLLHILGGVDRPTSGKYLWMDRMFMSKMKMNWLYSEEGRLGLSISFII